MPPYISTRAFIQWLPDGTRSEPTLTKVLTSSQRHFVDVRISKDRAGTDDSQTQRTIKLRFSDLDWAFAGTSSSSQEADGKTLSQWHHWIDSKTRKPEEVVDKGEMLPEDGEFGGLALEKGEMVNPESGRLEAYVEGWREEVPRAVGPFGEGVGERVKRELEEGGVFVSGSATGNASAMRREGTGPTSRLSLVMQHESAELGSRGMAVRVGHLCAGVARVGDDFGLELWKWTGSDGGWCKTHVLGEMAVPCDVLALLGESVEVGTEVRYGTGGDRVWRCLEAERW